MSDDEDKVTRLPIKFRDPPGEDDEPMLRVVTQWDRGACNHQYRIGSGGRIENATYLLRKGETEVECGFCGVRLDPMYVLIKLANSESQWLRNRERYLDEMKRLGARSRTTCEHCGKMTRISRS